MTCQIVKDTMKRVKQGGMGKEEFAFNGDRWKVLMSDTPSSITHSKFGSGLHGHLEKSSYARPRNCNGLCEGVVGGGLVKGTWLPSSTLPLTLESCLELTWVLSSLGGIYSAQPYPKAEGVLAQAISK